MITKISKTNLEKFEFYEKHGFIDAGIEIPCSCNFACKYCYRDEIVPNISFKVIVDCFSKLKDMGVFNIYLTGGEVTTYKYFRELYLHLKHEGFIVYILSNGSKIYKHIDLLKNYPPANIFITIYGTNEFQYKSFTGFSKHYSEVYKSLKLLSDNNIPFNLNTNVTKCNYTEVMNGSYTEFAKIFGKTINYNYLLIPTFTKKYHPLQYQLSEDQIIAFLSRSKKLYKNAKCQPDFNCNSGKFSINVSNCENVSICLKDRNHSISIQNETPNLVSFLKERATTIKKIADKSNCVSCHLNSACEWCPIQFEYNKKQRVFICNLIYRIEKEFSNKGEK